MTRALVCGGRDYNDVASVEAVLGGFFASPEGLTINELGCGYDPRSDKFQGADQLAYEWAKRHVVPGRCYPAHWERDGKAAGPLRNRRMLEGFKPDVVIAFPGGPGTADMVSISREAGLDVWEVKR